MWYVTTIPTNIPGWTNLTTLYNKSFNVTINYSDVIMSATASQIKDVSIVYSTVCSDADQRKPQSSAPLAFVREIHRWSVNSPHIGPVTLKMSSCMQSQSNRLTTRSGAIYIKNIARPWQVHQIYLALNSQETPAHRPVLCLQIHNPCFLKVNFRKKTVRDCIIHDCSWIFQGPDSVVSYYPNPELVIGD